MKTHWKNLHNYEYLGAYSLEEGQDLTLTIKAVRQEQVKGQNGKDEPCLVAYFHEETKGMIINKTNAKTIQQIHGTPYIEEWSGKQITLYSATVSAFGDTTEALRIRPFKPKVEIDPTEAIEKLQACIDLNEMKATWNTLTIDEKNNPQVIKTKNKLKNELA